MKRKIFLAAAIALFAIGAVVTTSVNRNNVMVSDIETMAKAQMTSDEFKQLTGCDACQCTTKCSGKDGKTYTAAKKPAAQLMSCVD